MARGTPGETPKHSRQITTERDFMGAVASVRRTIKQTSRAAKEDSRLRSLMKEMDEYEEGPSMELDPASSDSQAGDHDGPHRRWGDGTPKD